MELEQFYSIILFATAVAVMNAPVKLCDCLQVAEVVVDTARN